MTKFAYVFVPVVLFHVFAPATDPLLFVFPPVVGVQPWVVFCVIAQFVLAGVFV